MSARRGMRALFVPVFCLALSTAAAAGPMLDAHSHYTAGNAEAVSPAEVVAKLDAAGVSRVVVSGTPWQVARQLHAHAPDRVIPLLGVYANHLGKALWMHDETLPDRVESWLEEGDWAGIGELHLFARDAGSAVFARLVRMADARGLMLMIHGDAAVVDRAFELAPDARVLWAHLGTVPVPAYVDRVLARHAGRALWVDTSVRDERIAPGGELLPEWQALFKAHPRRFVVAVDTFSTNRWHHYGEVVGDIRQWLTELPPELQERMLWRNAEELFAPWLAKDASGRD